MSLVAVNFQPQDIKVTVKKGETLLDAALKAKIALTNLCGGDGICGRCKMVVKNGRISYGISEKLTREEIQKGYVLACIAIIESDLTVTVPEQTLAREKEIADRDADRFRDLEFTFRTGRWETSPLVRKVYLQLEKPSLANNIPDHQRICTAIKRICNVYSTQTGLKVIKTLPDILRKNNYCITATIGIRANIAEVLFVEGGDTVKNNYLFIIDIGTTTIVSHLIDANTLKTIDAKACFNSQGVYGREITGRLIAAEKKGVDLLHKVLIDDINQLVQNLTIRNSIDFKDVTAVICAGNTAMSHFLLGLPIWNIRRTPYIATSVEPPPLRAAEVGININPRGLLYSLPGISAWVGGDLTCGIIATEIYDKEELSLLIDIGTNGEVIVGNKEWLISCSASTGPALEGASVECGMRAEKGAIEKVFMENDTIGYKTIGDVTPKGICGSGIIDLISVMLKNEIINRSGKIIKKISGKIEIFDGIKGYILVPEEHGFNNNAVFITEADIENVITAKAAIFAAVKILLQRLDLQFSDIENFYIAGGFGNYLDIDSSIAIGLMPNISRKKIKFVGNTSIQGAKIVGLCRDALHKIIEIGANTTYYDLMGAEDYIQEFTKARFLPHTDIEAFC